MLGELRKRRNRLRRRSVRLLCRLAVFCINNKAIGCAKPLLLAGAYLSRRDRKLNEHVVGICLTHDTVLEDARFRDRLLVDPDVISVWVERKMSEAGTIPEWDRRLDCLMDLNAAYPDNALIASEMFWLLPNGRPLAREVAAKVRIGAGRGRDARDMATRWASRLWSHDMAEAALQQLEPFEGDLRSEWQGNVLFSALAFTTGHVARAVEALETCPPSPNGETNEHHLETAILNDLPAGPALDAPTRRGIEIIRSRWRHRTDDAPAPATREKLRTLRETLGALRAACPAGLARGDGSALICPVHRPSDLENLLAQIDRQDCPGAEVVIAVNNTDGIDLDRLRTSWQPPMRKRILDLGAQPTVGAALNHAIAATDAAFLIRMDADCLYFPNYAKDMIACRAGFGADVVAKCSKFYYWPASGIFEVADLDSAYTDLTRYGWAGGSAQAFTRQAWDAVRYNENHPIGEDVAFVAKALSQDFKVKLTDPYNHVVMQYATRGHHTYDPDPLWMALGQQRFLVAMHDFSSAEV